VNRNEAKNILLLYRTEADAADPQIAAAIALAKLDAELSRWFAEHRAAQNALREKFRQIEVPGGLAQQIISEQQAKSKTILRRPKMIFTAAVCAVAILVALGLFIFENKKENLPRNYNTLANYENQMIGVARSVYAMDLAKNDLTQIKNYLAQNRAPADYTLTMSLEKTAATGCAVQNWYGAHVSMICFSTGKPLPKNQPGDLWLFVVDRSAVKDAPQTIPLQIVTIKGNATAIWTDNGKLYLLGVQGDEQTLRKYL